VIVEALLASEILLPATKETLDDDPLSEKLVAVGTVGPTIVMLDAPELKVMLFPATSETLAVVPLRVKVAPPPPPPPPAATSGRLSVRETMPVLPVTTVAIG